MVARHQLHGRRSEVAFAVKLSSIEQHLCEAQIIASRRGKARSARLPWHREQRVSHRRTSAGHRIELRLGDAIFGVRQKKTCVHHSQWAKNLLLKKLAERLSTDYFHYSTEDVG